MALVVFLDTMLFLHYRPLADIDWCEALGADAVRIVVPRITLRELDDHKDHHPNATLRDRARAALRTMSSGLSVVGAPTDTLAGRRGKTIRDHVTLELQGLTPPFDFKAAQLDAGKNDDQLIASMLTLRTVEPAAALILVSGDTTARLTAEDFGLDVLEPPEAWRLPPTPDPERRELEALRAENVRLKSAHPKLCVVFAQTVAAEPETCLLIPDVGNTVEPRDQWAAAESAEARAVPARTVGDQPEVMPPSRPHTGPPGFTVTYAIQPPTPAEFARYSAERTAYLADFNLYLRDRWAYEARMARLVDLALVVANRGSGVADDVEVHITVPPPLEIVEPDMVALVRRAPHAPQPPAPPKTLQKQMMRGLNPFGGFDGANVLSYASPRIAFAARSAPNAVDDTKYADGTRTFVWHVRRVKHNVDVELPVVTVSWPPDVPMASLTLDVTVHAVNLPSPARSALHLRIVPLSTV